MFDFNALNKTVDQNVARVYGGWSKWNDPYVRRQLDRAFTAQRERMRTEEFLRFNRPRGDSQESAKKTPPTLGKVKINRVRGSEPGSLRSIQSVPMYNTPTLGNRQQFKGFTGPFWAKPGGKMFGVSQKPKSPYPAFRTSGLPTPKRGMPDIRESIRRLDEKREWKFRQRTPIPTSWEQPSLPMSRTPYPAVRRSNTQPKVTPPPQSGPGWRAGAVENKEPGQMALFTAWHQERLPLSQTPQSSWKPVETKPPKSHQYKIPYKGYYRGNQKSRKPLPPIQ